MAHSKRLALTGALAASALLLTACGGSSSEQASGDGAFTMFGAQPQNPLIPAMTNETAGGTVVDALFTRLVQYNNETAAPELANAESIEPSEENTLWTVKLKPGWTFHDGTPVTSSSYVDAWNWAAKCGKAPLNQYFFGPDGLNIAGYDKVSGTTEDGVTFDCDGVKSTMSGLTVVDDSTFTVKLAAPVSIFRTIVGYSAFSPMPDSFFGGRDAFIAHPIGNGPFQFVSAKPNESIVMTRFDGYQGDHKAQVKDVTYKIYQTPDAAYVDLLANNLDIMDTMPTTALAGDRWKSELGDRSILKPIGVFQSISYPLYQKKFQNPDLRKAISMAIDRTAVINVAYNNTREPADGWVPPVIDGYQPDVCGTNCTFDAAAAKDLFDKAGGYDGTLTIAYNADGGHKEWVDATCVSIKNTLGVECQGKPYPTFAEFRTDVVANKMDGLFRTGWQMDYPSIQNFLAPLYVTGAGSNDGGYSNAEFDQLVRDASSLPEDQAIANYQAAQKLLDQDMPVIPLWFGALTGGWSTNVNTPEFTPMGRVDMTSVSLKS